MSSKEALSDYSEIFQENFDRIDKEQDSVREAFQKLNTWLRKTMPKDMKDDDKPYLIYQYHPDTQTEFMDLQSIISSKLESVFTVVKDINEISAVGTSTYNKSQNIMSEGEGGAQQAEKQVINFNANPKSEGGFLKNPFKSNQTNIPKSVEDFWIRSENWKEEIMNYPNIWGKLITYHHYGVIRQKIFDGDGMDNYLESEIVYLNTRVEPNIEKVIKRAGTIMRNEVISGLQSVYMTTQQAENQMEMAKIQTGQATEG